VLFVSEDTGVTDVAMDPTSPDTLYAAAYQRRRTVFGSRGAGPRAASTRRPTAVHVEEAREGPALGHAAAARTRAGARGAAGRGAGAADAGAQATAAPGASAPAADKPEPGRQEIGRIGLGIYRRDSNIVYALVEHAGAASSAATTGARPGGR